MGLTQYRHGIPFVVAVSFASWLTSNVGYSCFVADVYPDRTPPDARLGGCDSYLTGALRALTGDTYRKPAYDIIYDTNFTFIWLFGIVFTAWYFARYLSLRRQTMTQTTDM